MTRLNERLVVIISVILLLVLHEVFSAELMQMTFAIRFVLYFSYAVLVAVIMKKVKALNN